MAAEGTVFVQFVVTEHGEVQDAVCVRSPNAVMCDVALEAVRESEFEPGRFLGRPASMRYTLPVRFK